MNDWHNWRTKTTPPQSIWRRHPILAGDSDKPAYGARKYPSVQWLIPAVPSTTLPPDELAGKYDIDGIEFGFQRCWRLFHNEKSGREPRMTDFVKRVRHMLDGWAKRGKAPSALVRSCIRWRMPEIASTSWIGDRRLLDMINVSSCYLHSTEVEIEEYA